MSDWRWNLLQEARPKLVDALRPVGVVRVEYVAAFPQSDSFTVWLGTNTDEERDQLGTANPCIDEVRAVLTDTGFPANMLDGLRTTAQSQETVDREYDGSWFYALR